MDIAEIIKRGSEKTASKDLVINWLKDVTPTRDLIKVDRVKIGDTFWRKLVGGKHRPWVILNITGKGDERMVTAASLTHADLECGFTSKCRYWKDVFIGSTVTSVPERKILNGIYYPYLNTKHLREIREAFKARLG